MSVSYTHLDVYKRQRYSIQGMRTGGPYRVEISYIGYQTVIYKDITLQLGEVYNLNVE